MSELQSCPGCAGKGHVGPVHVNRGSKPHEWRKTMPCLLCKGAGKITPLQAACVDRGKKLRAWRISKDKSLLEMARQVNLHSADLSAFETGCIDPAAWDHPFATTLRNLYEADQSHAEPPREG